MGDKIRFKKIKKQKFVSTPQKSISDYRDHGLKFSFEEFDTNQSIGVSKWHDLEHCVPMVEKFLHYGKHCKYKNMFDDKFKTYPSFPSNSKFKHPSHVTLDAKWASMHLGNIPCVIGHLVENAFYIIFFDPNHDFYPMQK